MCLHDSGDWLSLDSSFCAPQLTTADLRIRTEACQGVCGFFSGEVESFSETEINKGLELHEACERARILVVCQKLETGYDEPRLAVMYVDRKLEGTVTLVQVLSRVNRQMHGKSHAHIVDFHGRASDAARSFSAYRREVMLQLRVALP